MSEELARIAPYFCQLSYVVCDLDRAQRWFQSALGVPYFSTLRLTLGPPNFRCRNQPAEMSADVSHGYFGEIQVEIIRPVSDGSIYSDFLQQKGPGLHHVGFLVPDYTATVNRLIASGLPVLQDGAVTEGFRVDFTYFDCEFAGASVVEILGADHAARSYFDEVRRTNRQAS